MYSAETIDAVVADQWQGGVVLGEQIAETTTPRRPRYDYLDNSEIRAELIRLLQEYKFPFPFFPIPQGQVSDSELARLLLHPGWQPSAALLSLLAAMPNPLNAYVHSRQRLDSSWYWRSSANWGHLQSNSLLNLNAEAPAKPLSLFNIVPHQVPARYERPYWTRPYEQVQMVPVNENVLDYHLLKEVWRISRVDDLLEF
jgi:hypothetical protein